MLQKSFKNFIKQNRLDLFICLLILLAAPLFFYNLGSYNLEDFDEAWYGEVARNITTSANPLILTFNGKPYLNHPPVGFNLMALSILIFGPNELGVRAVSALSGLLCLIFIYFIGKNLFNRQTGFAASLILLSSVWFMFRARSGNLDTLLVFFYILTFYFTVKLIKNRNYLYPLSISFAALVLTKSLIGLSLLLPVVTLVLINRLKITPKSTFLSLALFFTFTAPWFFINWNIFGNYFIAQHLILTLRSDHVQKIDLPQILNSSTFLYLHYGLRKWYYPAIFSAIFAAFLLFKSKKSFLYYKNLLPLLVWILTLLFIFLRNSKTEIWHLLPLYPPFALLIGFTISYSVGFCANLLKVKSLKFKAVLVFVVSVLPILALSFLQMWNFKNEIKLFDKSYSGLSQASSAAKGLSQPLYLDSDLPVPAVAAFYSQKHVSLIQEGTPGSNTLKTHMSNAPRPFLLITELWKLNLDGIKPQDYTTLFENKGFVLIKVTKPSSS